MGQQIRELAVVTVVVQVTAMAWVGSLAPERPHTTGMVLKKKKKKVRIFLYFKMMDRHRHWSFVAC